MVDIISNMKYDCDPSLKSIFTKFVPPFKSSYLTKEAFNKRNAFIHKVISEN